MPAAAMLASINTFFVPPALDDLDAQAFKPGSVDDAIKALGLEGNETVRSYVEAMPKAVILSIMASIYSAVTSDPRSTVTMAFVQGSHYNLKVAEAPPATDEPRGAVTLVLTGPLTG